MLIVSKFHDYYDTAIGFGGVDKTIVYNRTPKLFSKNGYNIPYDWKDAMKLDDEKTKILDHDVKLSLSDVKSSVWSWYSTIPQFFPQNDQEHEELFFLIGFCGKKYLGYKLITKKIYSTKSHIDFYFGDEIINFHQNIISSKLKKMHWRDKHGVSEKKHTKEFVHKFHEKENLEKFRRFNVPIYLETRNFLILNPNLKDFGFFKVFDSFSAFQEIEMFLGGVLGTSEKETINIDEKYRQAQAGMDNWSFRNPDPPKRKQRKQKK